MKKKKKKEHRRVRGSGSVYLVGRTYRISYIGADGLRKIESTGFTRKSDADRLAAKRTGSRDLGLAIAKNDHKLTFTEAALLMIDDFTINRRRSLAVVDRRIEKHLKPFFGAHRMASITAGHVQAYTRHRIDQGIVRNDKRASDVSNGEINRELSILKRIFNLAISSERLASAPKITLLKEDNVRTGFFDRDQIESVLRHLDDEVGAVVEFAYETGWRLHSEVLPLQWRQVDFEAGTIRLDPGTTKNGKGRTFRMTKILRRVLEARQVEHETMKKAGHICPQVFFRKVSQGRGGPKRPVPITSINKAWKNACKAAGCPGRIPHDLRRSAVRNMVRAGIPERVCMELTGHKTRSIFDRYDIVNESDLDMAADRLDAATVAAASRKSS